jgi:hypothetical protein
MPWLITQYRAYSMVETGHCYDVYHAYEYVGRVCMVACDLEYEESLWNPGMVRSAKMAVKVLIAQNDMPMQQAAD